MEIAVSLRGSGFFLRPGSVAKRFFSASFSSLVCTVLLPICVSSFAFSAASSSGVRRDLRDERSVRMIVAFCTRILVSSASSAIRTPFFFG